MFDVHAVIGELRKRNPDGFKNHKHFMIAFRCAIEKACVVKRKKQHVRKQEDC